MAANETQFRTELAEAARLIRGHVAVTHGAMVAGIPDLFIQIPELPGCWVECKFIAREKPQGVLALTAGQRIFIKRHQKAGGYAGWALCVKLNNMHWVLAGGSDPETHEVNIEHHIQHRTRGELWDVKKLIMSLTKTENVNQSMGRPAPTSTPSTP